MLTVSRGVRSGLIAQAAVRAGLAGAGGQIVVGGPAGVADARRSHRAGSGAAVRRTIGSVHA